MMLVATLGATALAFLPRRVCGGGTDLVAAVSWRLSRTYRRNVIANLRQALGPDAPRAEVEAFARQAFGASARNIEALLQLTRVPTARLVESVHLVRGDWSILDRALAGGRGAVVVTGHIGAFDLLGHVLAGRGYRLTAIVGRTLPRPLFDAAVMLRAAHGVTVVEASPRGVRRAIETLRAGECVGFVGDRDFFENGVAIDFFGRRTTLPSGAVRAARATGAPIVAGVRPPDRPRLRAGNGGTLLGGAHPRSRCRHSDRNGADGRLAHPRHRRGSRRLGRVSTSLAAGRESALSVYGR